MANNFQNIEQQGVAAIEKIEQSLKELNGQLEITNTKVKSIFTTVSTPGALSKQVDELKTKLNELNSVYEKQQKEIKNLNTTTQDQINKTAAYQNTLEGRTKEEIKAEKQYKKMFDAQAKFSSSYNQLIAKQKQAKQTLRDLIVSQGKNSAETKKAQREYDKLTAKVNQANKATSNFSKTGLGSTVRGFKNLLGAFGVVGGVYLFADFAKQGFNLARQLDSLNFTMKAVISDAETLERTQLFLAQTAEKYGASILTLTERYNKFYTAARQSGVTLEDTEDVFRSFTKSAGFLGLRSHELEGVFLALEQMLSKGKVTTEELRRQLGERLPGAFGVMADTVNKLNPDIEVTVEVLDEMLKKGQILSHEVLPEFARQYEKSIGIEQKERVETLNASVERMTNSWVAFIQSVSTGEGILAKVLIGTVDYINKVIKGLEYLAIGTEAISKQRDFNIYNETLKERAKHYQELGDEANAYALIEQTNADNRIKSLEEQRDKEQLIIDTQKKKYGALAFGNRAYRDALINIDKINGSIATQKAILEAATRQLNGYVEEQDEAVKKGRTLADVMKDLADANKELQNSTKEEASAILDRIDKLNKEKEAWERLTKAKKENKKEIELIGEFGSRDFIEAQIQGLKEQIDKTAKLTGNNGRLSESYNELQRELKFYEAWLERVYGDKKQKDIDDTNKLLQENIQKWSDLQNALNKEKEELQNDFFEGFKDEFFSDLGFDFTGEMFFSGEIDEETGRWVSNFEKISQAAKENGNEWAVWANTVMEVGQEVFAFLQQQQQAYFEARFDNLRRDRDLAIEYAGDSATAKEEIERQYEEKRRKLQREQAEANKKNAIFNTVINTAQAVVSMLAQAPWPSNFVFAALAAAMGAAQIAMISSQPTPNYWGGREDGNGEWAIVDELRPEVHTDKYGNVKSMGSELGANRRWLEDGDKIYSSRQKYFNSQLDSLLDSNGIAMSSSLSIGQPMIIENKGLSNELFERKINSLEKTIKSKENINISVTKNGVRTKKGGKELLNNQLRLKGRQV